MTSANKKNKLIAISFFAINTAIFASFLDFFLKSKVWVQIGMNGIFLIIGVFIIIMLLQLLVIKKFNPNLFEAIAIYFYDEKETVAKLETEKFLLELRNNIINNNETTGGKKISEKEIDILELMLANMGEVKNYYALSIIQAKNSFKLAVSMCIFGIALIVSSIIWLYFSNSSELALIPFISGAIVEVIAGTTLFVYKSSLSQLNHYYASLHSNERFLSLVHLVSKISENKRDEVYSDIIKTELNNCKITNNN